jgi:AAA+ superfamily predicted ATPase
VSNKRKTTPMHEMGTYAEQMRDQMARARENAAVICVIDGDGQIAVTSPMGYGRRQVAAFLDTLAVKINRECDNDGVPQLADDEKPTEIPDDALHES